jgi:hypothetical protein
MKCDPIPSKTIKSTAVKVFHEAPNGASFFTPNAPTGGEQLQVTNQGYRFPVISTWISITLPIVGFFKFFTRRLVTGTSNTHISRRLLPYALAHEHIIKLAHSGLTSPPHVI